jgi:chromate transporter
MSAERPAGRLAEVIAVFLKLGIIGFGGPAAHIGMMHDEVVRRRKWVTDQEFLDLLGATNLIPGPNSTEMTIHLGYLRAGWPGLIAGGASFILPAMLIVTALAWAYVRYGATPAAGWLLWGIKPVVMAVIVQAIYSLGSKALRGWPLGVAAAVAFGLYFLGVNELALLFGLGLVVMVGRNAGRLGGLPRNPAWLLPLGGLTLPLAAQAPFSLGVLFATFLKIGAVLYGSGYVLLAFLRGDFVTRLGWLTDQQLIDAISIGQVTPGPLFTTATFIGYLLGGIPGALLGTVGIFLPAFVFVAISNPLIPRLRASPWLSGLLDGVNAAALGLMAAVTAQLAQDALVDAWTVGMALLAGFLLLRYKLNATWLVLGGALAGLLRFWIGG